MKRIKSCLREWLEDISVEEGGRSAARAGEFISKQKNWTRYLERMNERLTRPSQLDKIERKEREGGKDVKNLIGDMLYDKPWSGGGSWRPRRLWY
jgi:hypothetical protein